MKNRFLSVLLIVFFLLGSIFTTAPVNICEITDRLSYGRE